MGNKVRIYPSVKSLRKQAMPDAQLAHAADQKASAAPGPLDSSPLPFPTDSGDVSV